MASKQYERVGGGTYGVYREKKKGFFDSVAEFLGGVIIIGVGVAVLNAIFG